MHFRKKNIHFAICGSYVSDRLLPHPRTSKHIIREMSLQEVGEEKYPYL